MSNLQHKLEELLGFPRFAEVRPKIEVSLFDPFGTQLRCLEFDDQNAADDFARTITRDHPELSATIASSDTLNVYCYESGQCLKYFVEAQA